MWCIYRENLWDLQTKDSLIRRTSQLGEGLHFHENKVSFNCTAINIQITSFIKTLLPTLLKDPALLTKPPNLKPQRSALWQSISFGMLAVRAKPKASSRQKRKGDWACMHCCVQGITLETSRDKYQQLLQVPSMAAAHRCFFAHSLCSRSARGQQLLEQPQGRTRVTVP